MLGETQAQVDGLVRPLVAQVPGGRQRRIRSSSQSAASSSDPVGAESIFASAASAPSMRGGCLRGPKYERTRVRRSPALPT